MFKRRATEISGRRRREASERSRVAQRWRLLVGAGAAAEGGAKEATRVGARERAAGFTVGLRARLGARSPPAEGGYADQKEGPEKNDAKDKTETPEIVPGQKAAAIVDRCGASCVRCDHPH
jgi:hypothetical protein